MRHARLVEAGAAADGRALRSCSFVVSSGSVWPQLERVVLRVHRAVPLSAGDGNMSLVPTEAPFTPIRSLWAAKKSICTEKTILRESGVNLGYLIINRHVLMSPIEKNRAFWARRDV